MKDSVRRLEQHPGDDRRVRACRLRRLLGQRKARCWKHAGGRRGLHQRHRQRQPGPIAETFRNWQRRCRRAAGLDQRGARVLQRYPMIPALKTPSRTSAAMPTGRRCVRRWSRLKRRPASAIVKLEKQVHHAGPGAGDGRRGGRAAIESMKANPRSLNLLSVRSWMQRGQAWGRHEIDGILAFGWWLAPWPCCRRVPMGGRPPRFQASRPRRPRRRRQHPTKSRLLKVISPTILISR